jgi:hypothetical protein
MPTGSFYPEITEIVDFESIVSMWAVEAIMNHWDGFIYQVRNNYRIYHEPMTDKWSVIPSGVDQTFTTSNDRSAFSVSSIVARRCFEEAECKAAFAAKLVATLEVFEASDFGAKAAAIRDRIATEVQNDPRKPGTYQNFLDKVTETITFVTNRPATIRADLTNNGFPQ